MNIVMITDGGMRVAEHLHTFPAKAVGVIELSKKSVSKHVYFMRKMKRIATFRQYGTLKEYATHTGLNYRRIFCSDDEALKNTLTDWGCELVVTSRCPVIPMNAIEHLKYGAINLHPSLLPSYRGGDPMFWQVHDQIERVGSTVHYLTEKADTGPILAQESVARPRCAGSQELSELLEGDIGVKLLKTVISKIRGGTAEIQIQPEESPTRPARNVPLKNFHRHVDMDQLTLEALHDLVAYFGEWPAALGKYERWRRWFRWVPQKMVPATQSGSTFSNGSLQPKGHKELLMHRDGHIVLAPRISAKLIVDRLLSSP